MPIPTTPTFKKNQQCKTHGFTLIELMVTIAIIGILASIAIPNFISYRNKSFCSKAESDANHVASQISDFYSVPSRTRCVTIEDVNADTITQNSIAISCKNDNPNNNIIISVTDNSGRCPLDYQVAVNSVRNPTGYWDGSSSFIKIIQ